MTETAPSMPDPGFAEPVFDAQESFRAVLSALARPGTIQTVTAPQSSPAPLPPSVTAVALTLFDQDTPVWLDAESNRTPVSEFLRFHCGCPLVEEPDRAAFAVIADPGAMPSLDTFEIGEDQYPDGSATVLIALPSLHEGARVRLRGPGIKETATVAPAGLPDGFWRQFNANQRLFPLGVDIVLASGNAVLGLPRSIQAEI